MHGNYYSSLQYYFKFSLLAFPLKWEYKETKIILSENRGPANPTNKNSIIFTRCPNQHPFIPNFSCVNLFLLVKMPMQVSKIIATLILLSLGFCSAMYANRPYSRGVRIRNANCNGRIHTSLKLAQTVDRGVELMNELTQSGRSIEFLIYHPQNGGILNTGETYYFFQINTENPDDPARDFVVITRAGVLLKVVTQMQIAEDSWMFVNCLSNEERILETGIR